MAEQPAIRGDHEFDAMTSARHRTALPVDEAARRLRADAGAPFEVAVVEAFDRAEAEIRSMVKV